MGNFDGDLRCTFWRYLTKPGLLSSGYFAWKIESLDPEKDRLIKTKAGIERVPMLLCMSGRYDDADKAVEAMLKKLKKFS